ILFVRLIEFLGAHVAWCVLFVVRIGAIYALRRLIGVQKRCVLITQPLTLEAFSPSVLSQLELTSCVQTEELTEWH
ncbi:hypothetical protein B0H14DRAFT_2825983, partial [Mycena olivaceomarginata]